MRNPEGVSHKAKPPNITYMLLIHLTSVSSLFINVDNCSAYVIIVVMSNPYTPVEKNPGSTEEFARAMDFRFKERVAAHEAAINPGTTPETRIMTKPAAATVIEAANSTVPTEGPNATS